jgi:hypothetical protein
MRSEIYFGNAHGLMTSSSTSCATYIGRDYVGHSALWYLIFELDWLANGVGDLVRNVPFKVSLLGGSKMYPGVHTGRCGVRRCASLGSYRLT